MINRILNFILKKLGTSKKSTSNKPRLKPANTIILEEGKTETICLPDFNKYQNLTIAKWHFHIGDMIEGGDIICEIQNNQVTIEFESLMEGELIWSCEPNKKLTTGMDICTIRGVANE
ncbi:protein of unknown function [Tenacibaculum sp. 190130A14a]|uniref:Lipoyl-binding domain-containing protein n=1 Tax=Tenacibaculum polynesiense TaxID=3137857 RepID=A0ABP1F5U3_9FLAO